jgi:cellulose synthase/poly-beta-1,6-N-acetylglucosamine synthase-like glycosyltransferase
MSVYNGGRYLRPAVESILGQSFTDFELLVVEDGSTDNSPAILAEYAAADGRLRIISNESNIGLTRSLNKGVALARGEIIARQDADDLSASDRLARQIAFLDERPEVGLVGTLTQVIDAEGRPLAREHFPIALSNEAIQRQLLSQNCICHGSVMFRRSLLALVGPYDETVGPVEDYDLWLRLAEVTELANLDARLYAYRDHDEAVTERRHPEVVACQAALLARTLRRRQVAGPPGEAWAPVARTYLRAAIAGQAAGVAGAAANLAEALAICPALLAADEPLETLVLDYAAKRPPAERAPFVDQLFGQLLPATAAMARRRRRLLAGLHMQQVFRAARQRAYSRVRAHLWPAIRHNPAWLLNRGVLVIAAQALWRRGGSS